MRHKWGRGVAQLANARVERECDGGKSGKEKRLGNMKEYGSHQTDIVSTCKYRPGSGHLGVPDLHRIHSSTHQAELV